MTSQFTPPNKSCSVMPRNWKLTPRVFLSCTLEVNYVGNPWKLPHFFPSTTSAHLKTFKACFVSSPPPRCVWCRKCRRCLSFQAGSVVFCVSCLKQHVSQAGRLWEDVCVRKRVCARWAKCKKQYACLHTHTTAFGLMGADTLTGSLSSLSGPLASQFVCLSACL